MRINVKLEDKNDWVKLFNPRDVTIFVAHDEPPGIGTQVRIDLIVGKGGPKVIFRGKVIARRLQGDDSLPKGCNIALGHDEKEKINYLNGYVRGGMLDLRETRRIPVRLKVTYGGIEGPVDSHTRDVNEEGVFIISDDPLPEESEVHIFIHLPDQEEPISLGGIVVHTVVVEDEDIPGMGIRFVFDDSEDEKAFLNDIDRLEQLFATGKLTDSFLV